MKLTKIAEEVLTRVGEGEQINNILEEYSDKTDWSCSDGFGYGLYEGGYIRPELIVEGEDLEKLQEAIRLVGEFKSVWDKISIEF